MFPKFHVVHEPEATLTVSTSLPVEPVLLLTLTVTALLAVIDWLFASFDHDEHKLLTFMVDENTILTLSPCSIVPAVPPLLFWSVTLEIVGCALIISVYG